MTASEHGMDLSEAIGSLCIGAFIYILLAETNLSRRCL